MIRVRGPLTAWIGDEIRVLKEAVLQTDDELELMCRGCLLTRSFVNAHTHLPMILLRGLVTELNFWDWLEKVKEMEELMSKKEMRAGYVLGLWENLLSGNTVVYSMYRDYGLIEETFGLEVHAGPISFREADQDVVSLLERFEKKAPENVVPTLFAHSLYTLPLERLKEMSELLKERPLEFQIHVSETKEEVLKVKKRFGQYPVRVLEALGLLSDRTMLVHAGWITKSELDVASGKKASLVHVPASNARLAIHGFFPWKEAAERGIKVFFGTDSPASNDGQSILHDLRLALLFAKDRYWDAEPFGWKSVQGAFDRTGFALWKPADTVALWGKALITTFLNAPNLFQLRLLVKKGQLIYPRLVPPEVKRSLRVARRFVDRFLNTQDL